MMIAIGLARAVGADMRKQYHARVVEGDTHIWDIDRLVDLSKDFSVFQFPIDGIRELDENWWYSDPGSVPTPRSVAAHMKLVRQTDLENAIILCAEGRLMDGMHRVVRALLEGHSSIKAVRFPRTPQPDYVNVSLDDLSYDEADR